MYTPTSYLYVCGNGVIGIGVMYTLSDDKWNNIGCIVHTMNSKYVSAYTKYLFLASLGLFI